MTTTGLPPCDACPENYYWVNEKNCQMCPNSGSTLGVNAVKDKDGYTSVQVSFFFKCNNLQKYWYTCTDYNNSLFVTCNNYLTHQLLKQIFYTLSDMF
jgi:hypothetical protein